MTKKLSEHKKLKPSNNLEKLRKENPFLQLFEGISSTKAKRGQTFIEGHLGDKQTQQNIYKNIL